MFLKAWFPKQYSKESLWGREAVWLQTYSKDHSFDELIAWWHCWDIGEARRRAKLGGVNSRSSILSPSSVDLLLGCHELVGCFVPQAPCHNGLCHVAGSSKAPSSCTSLRLGSQSYVLPVYCSSLRFSHSDEKWVRHLDVKLKNQKAQKREKAKRELQRAT